MGVLAYLVPTATAEGGALGRNPSHGTEGASWRFDFEELVDANGALIPQATISGFTCVCNIYAPGGVIVASATFSSSGDGKFSLAFDEATTAGLAGGARTPRVCSWGMSLSDGTDTVQFWKPGDSPFTIHHADVN